MADPPTPGTFVLHSRAVPDLPAGPYTVRATQTITAPGASASSLDTHIEVTAPRFLLPADQVLSTFPPNQAEGAFSSRLPQIVLKRRTLPWERELDGKLTTDPLPRELPWMALVVLADAECEFLSAQPIASCVTSGVVLEGRNDATVADAIVVTQRVIDQVFPTKEELPLLAHVRSVDLSDTELALGDDDGWLAVVLSNRLPQPGVRYRACLISLEGQYDVLPDTAEIESEAVDPFGKTFVYEKAAVLTDELSYAYGGAIDGAERGFAPVDVVLGTAFPGLDDTLRVAARQDDGELLGTDVPRQLSSARSSTVADAWSSTSAAVQSSALTGGALKGVTATTATLVGAMHGVGMTLIDPGATQYTFPVLAQWQFTCTGAGDFQSLMQALDVGMLGTPPPAPTVPAPGAKPPPPVAPPPEVLDTGHVGLDYVSRIGESARAWYRGPLVPRPVAREQPDDHGVLALLHASDQARRVGQDGLENLALATAFEIGRLLALAEPSVVAALLIWRKDALDDGRRRALLAGEPLLSALDVDDLLAGFGARAGHLVVSGLGADGAAPLGATRPPVDAGMPIEGIDELALTDRITLIATGLGVPADAVSALVAGTASAIDVPVGERITDFGQLLEHADTELSAIRAAADDTAAAIAGEALGGPVGDAGGQAPLDALDQLLDQEGGPA